MKKKFPVLLFGMVAIAATSAMAGSKNPLVGGQEMYPTKDIVDNAVLTFARTSFGGNRQRTKAGASSSAYRISQPIPQRNNSK